MRRLEDMTNAELRRVLSVLEGKPAGPMQSRDYGIARVRRVLARTGADLGQAIKAARIGRKPTMRELLADSDRRLAAALVGYEERQEKAAQRLVEWQDRLRRLS